MPLVKPPTLRDLVKAGGDLESSIKRLVQTGFTPEEIEWKTGIPYYLIRLLLAGKPPKNPTPFMSVVETYERLATLRSKKGKETELAKFFRRGDLRLEVKVRLALGRVSDEPLKVGPGLIERALSLATGEPIRRVRSLLLDYGELGEVAYLLTPAREARLTVDEVYEAIRLLPELERLEERERHIASLLRTGSPGEAKYIIRLTLGDLKLGYSDQTVVRAAARAYGVSPTLLQEACAVLGLAEGVMLAPKGGLVLSSVRLRPGQFVKPQLAHLYDPDRVEYPVRAEYKIDGSRLQIHKWGRRIWLFSRRAVEKSQTLPEIVEAARGFRAHSCIIDSEVVAVDRDGNFLPFQYLLERTVPRRLSVEELERRRKRVGVTIQAFDILLLNGRELLRLPLSERRKYLQEVVPPEYIVGGRDCGSEAELMRFYEEALQKGFEGVVVKSLGSPYEVGRRTHTWLKLKPERDTIDCTIVKALYGKGRRAGLYSSFLMAVRHPTERKLYTIGKVSNLPESVMEALRDIVEQTRVNEDDEGVFLRPSVVVEVTFQEIQKTDEYTSGYALRVPKIVRFRPDKRVEDIDDLDKLRVLFETQYERYPTKTI